MLNVHGHVLHSCLQANNLAGKVTVAPLQWGQDCEEFTPPFSIIIASDLIYEMEQIPKLMLTIVSLSDSDTITYLAFELRPHVIRAAFQAVRAYGLTFQQVGHSFNEHRCTRAFCTSLCWN